MEEEEEESVNEPRTTIGAQDLLSLNTTSHNGILRYEGGLERFVTRSVIFKPFFREAVKWRQRFVVLCEGCLYIYKDEYSRSPVKAISLASYNRVRRIQGNETNERRRRMSFTLEPLNLSEKHLNFCSTTDEERKIWFQKIRKEMEQYVQGSSHLQSDFDQDEYVSLEKPVHPESTSSIANQKEKETIKQKVDNKKEKKNKTKEEKTTPKKPLPPVPNDNEDEEEEPEDDYDKIPDDLFLPKRPLPGVPTDSPTTKDQNRPCLKVPIKPKPAPKPAVKKATRFSRSEFEYNSNDRAKVEEILSDMTVGTFLVRKSRQDDLKVLSVKTEEGVKEYKIYKKERGFSIDNKEKWFSNTEELLDFYADHEIPNRVLTLTRGYSESGMRL